MRKYYLIIYSFIIVSLTQAQQYGGRPTNSRNFLQAFSELPKQDFTIATHDPFDFKFSQMNGHIQGIQLYENDGTDYLYMTRNSPNASYMIRAKLEDKKATVLSIDTLMLAPYGHPGGFQIFENYLAVGIEDEKSRTTSLVMVYDLKKQDKPWSAPHQMIKREGKYERVTAGCVGLTQVGKNILMVVGNWDSRDLDFYVCPLKKFKKGGEGFKLIQSMNMAELSKEGWSDTIWWSYQNINLFSDSENRLYLVGFAFKHADLFELKIADGGLKPAQSPIQNTIQIKKLRSENFIISGNASLGTGAGISYLSNGKLILLAAPGDIGDSSTISVSAEKNSKTDVSKYYSGLDML